MAQARLAGRRGRAASTRTSSSASRTGCSSTTSATSTRSRHMMWRAMDPGHPAYEPDGRAASRTSCRRSTSSSTGIVGRTLPRVEARRHDARRDVRPRLHELAPRVPPQHLAARTNGYLAVRDPSLQGRPGPVRATWTGRARAPTAGPQRALHQRRAGASATGSWIRGSGRRSRRRSRAKLLQAVDPKTGQRAVTKVYQRDEDVPRPRAPRDRPGPRRRLRQGHARLERVGPRQAHAARS